MEGDAVKSMTVAFLEMWNAAGNVKSKELVPEKYVINHAYQAQQRGMSSHMQTVRLMVSR